jgi:hypothetical protein
VQEKHRKFEESGVE